MYYGNIKKSDIANGPGVRVSLFVSGCTHRCKGCFNEIAWDFNYGNEFTEDTIDEIRRRFGKTAIVRANSLKKGGTYIARSNLVGGHSGGNSLE